MIIDRNVRKFLVFSEESILTGLEQMSRNKTKVLFALNKDGFLEGSITDGDFRRWLVKQSSLNLHQPVSEIMNINLPFFNVKERPEVISKAFVDRIEYIPLTDDYRRLVAVASKVSGDFSISGHLINDSSPCFVIAEIGNNHNGSLELAKALVDSAVAAGANCAKFQHRNLDSLYRKSADSGAGGDDLATEYTLDLLAKNQLSSEQLFEVFDYCHKKNIIPLCTPWDLKSLDELDGYGVAAFKIASADLTNHELLRAAANKMKPLICSTGMSTEQEIVQAVEVLRSSGAQFSLLHCNSTYPTPYKDINLMYLNRLKTIGECPVGYSGHERGVFVPVAAVALGAKIIEKHLTHDKKMEGNDHKISLLPDEFKSMVEQIRSIESALGVSETRQITQGELINRENLAKSLVASCFVKKGTIIKDSMIDIKSPGNGVQPNRRQELVGKAATRDLQAGDFFYESDIDSVNAEPRNYKFKRPWGIPVRFHDYMSFVSKSNPDLVEFHLSYKDLEKDIGQIKGSAGLDFVVHSPELFANDHILDLCSDDEAYRKHSIEELQRVINLTRDLKNLFPKTKEPCIVTNVGGFTTTAHLPVAKRAPLYDRFLASYAKLDIRGVRIIPQTMPSFPWHFGGQSFHNLFVAADEIATICAANGLQICLDISHSKLACNYYDWSLSDFISIVGPYVAHLHIADAEGVDGEGLQVGKGKINFSHLAEDLRQFCPKASFIPEIWQGHTNYGEGFWRALDLLEREFSF